MFILAGKMPPWIYLSTNIYLLIKKTKSKTLTEQFKVIIYTLSVNTHALIVFI